jgi:GTP cyclohydrolase III
MLRYLVEVKVSIRRDRKIKVYYCLQNADNPADAANMANLNFLKDHGSAEIKHVVVVALMGRVDQQYDFKLGSPI